MTETVFFWLALGMYVLSSIAYTASLAFTKETLNGAGLVLATGGLLLHTVALGMRWSITGHGPYISTYEILSSTAWTVVLFFLILRWRLKIFANIGSAVMSLSFIMMGFALMGSTEARTLPPSLRSVWLVVHVIFAKLTVAAMFIAVALSVFYLMKKRKGDRGFLSKLPSVAALDDWGYRLIAFGFITLTIMIITGAIWANNSWGSYWAWDPTETWSLAIWLVYGIYLHGRITFRWKGTISAWYIIMAFIFSVTAFFIIPYFIKSLHSQYMVD